MMRFQFATSAVLGALLLTPALTLGAQHNDSLEAALRRTVASLEELGRIEQRLRQQDPAAISDALRSTEPPLETSTGEAGARDAALVDLRGVVARLQHNLDELENKAEPQTLARAARRAPIEIEPSSERTLGVELTVGLDDALRRRLGERVRPIGAEAPRSAQPGPDAPRAGAAKTAFEEASYAADALRLGRALYRQGEYTQAHAALEGATDGDALYWKARCLEKLARDAEAIATYNQVLALPNGGYSAQRAKEDLEFLQWRIAFERTRSKAAGDRSEAHKP